MAEKPKKVKWASQRAYKNEPFVCPSCGSSYGITGDGVEIDEGNASQVVSCSECGAEWLDLYKLSSYSIRKYPTKTLTCALCGETCVTADAHLHNGNWIGDECCWDERLKSSE